MQLEQSPRRTIIRFVWDQTGCPIPNAGSRVTPIFRTLCRALLVAGLVSSPAAAQTALADSLERALVDADRSGDVTAIADALTDLGLEDLRAGAYASAVQRFDSARVIWTERGDSVRIARSLNNLGATHYQWGDLEPAIEAYDAALRIWRALGDLDGEAQVLTNQALLFRAWGLHGRAVTAARAAVDVARRDGTPRLVGYSINNLALAQMSSGDFASASAAFQEVLETTSRVGTPGLSEDDARSLRGMASYGLARVRLDQGDPQGAIGLLEPLFEDGPLSATSDRQSMALVALGRAHAALGELSVAIPILRRARDLSLASSQPTRATEAMTALAEIHRERGETGAALEEMSQVADLRQALLDRSAERRVAATENRVAADRQREENETLREDQARREALISRLRVIGGVGALLLVGVGAFAAVLVRFNRALRSQRRALEKANAELSAAMAEVRTLEGMIPICSNCKNIRSDAGYWESVESYITARSAASFTHGICSVCGPDLYGSEEWAEVEANLARDAGGEGGAEG